MTRQKKRRRRDTIFIRGKRVRREPDGKERRETRRCSPCKADVGYWEQHVASRKHIYTTVENADNGCLSCLKMCASQSDLDEHLKTDEHDRCAELQSKVHRSEKKYFKLVFANIKFIYGEEYPKLSLHQSPPEKRILHSSNSAQSPENPRIQQEPMPPQQEPMQHIQLQQPIEPQQPQQPSESADDRTKEGIMAAQRRIDEEKLATISAGAVVREVPVVGAVYDWMFPRRQVGQ
eukprot:166759_1